MSSYSGYCPVQQYGPHLATRRSGYCEPHHIQYTQEKRRWHSSMNNYLRKSTPNDPGSWKSRYAAIDWVPVQIQPNPEVVAPAPSDEDPQESTTQSTPSNQQPDAGECTVTLDDHMKEHLKQLADSIEVDIKILKKKATYDSEDFTRRWAAHVEDRIQGIELAAKALRELADCSPPNTQKKPRNIGF